MVNTFTDALNMSMDFAGMDENGLFSCYKCNKPFSCADKIVERSKLSSTCYRVRRVCDSCGATSRYYQTEGIRNDNKSN